MDGELPINFYSAPLNRMSDLAGQLENARRGVLHSMSASHLAISPGLVIG
jgi:hypothetical protein